MGIEAMKQALEALETEHSAIYGTSQTARAITSLRQAIAEAEKQEPVAYAKDLIEGLYENGDPISVDAAELLEQLTSPPQRQWVGLTDDEVHALWMIGEANISEAAHSVIAYEVETKLKEKNT